MNAVLYVDDEPAALRMFQKTFGAEFHVVTAGSAEAGLREAEEVVPDFILADERMPGTNGITFLEAVRAKCPHAIIAIVTAYSSMKSAAFAAGITNFFTKPYDAAEMRKFLSSASELPAEDEHDTTTGVVRVRATQATESVIDLLKKINSPDPR